MRKGYRYLGAIWPSISDCEEMALSVYQERVYVYAMRCLAFMGGLTADNIEEWKERILWYEWDLMHVARYKWGEVTIMD